MRTTNYMVYINVVPPIILDADAKKSVPGFNIYPNPATNQLFIRASSGAPATQFTITSAPGQTMISRSLTFEGQSVVGVNISSLSPGIYFLQLSNERTRTTATFIKQ